MMATIRRGSSGKLVATWQAMLNTWIASGEVIPFFWRNARGEPREWASRAHSLDVDGSFGQATEIATEAWQVSRGLDVDGIVGPKTWGTALGGAIDEPEPLLYGVDVSAMQGTINDSCWYAMRDKGIRFAIARVCVGNETWIDAQASLNIVRASSHGIVPGAYFFGYALKHIDPREQVEQWLKRCEVAGLDLGSLICALDMEWPPPEQWAKWLVDGPFVAEWNLAALERARELTGRPWVLYSYPWEMKSVGVGNYPEFARSPLWLANYFAAGRWPSPDEVAGLKVPGPWSQITICQHDGNGGLRLPSGVDADFNVLQGGEAELAELAQGGPVTSPELDLTQLTHDPMGIMHDSEIAAYRRSRANGEAA